MNNEIDDEIDDICHRIIDAQVVAANQFIQIPAATKSKSIRLSKLGILSIRYTGPKPSMNNRIYRQLLRIFRIRA